MASFDNCPYCGSVIRSDQTNCPGCGAPNRSFTPAPSPAPAPVPAAAPGQARQPETIEQLQAFCASRRMPLEKMRFFIGRDYPYPRAFGIYRDGENVVVYKNKNNGERAVRYRGRDEKRAVGELYDKLLEECHKRGLYPEGSPPPRPAAPAAAAPPRRVSRSRSRGCLSGGLGRLGLIFAVIVILGAVVSSCGEHLGHRKDGYYYRPGDSQVYYNYGGSWFYNPGFGGDDVWYETDAFPEENYESYSLGDEWSSAWGVGDFQDSDAWDELNSGSSDSSYSDFWDSDDSDWDSGWSDSDWDSWDSGGSDWDSDW